MKTTKKVRSSNLKEHAVTIGAVLAVIVLILMLIGINNDKEKTIAVTKAKNDIYTNQLITADNLYSYEMSLSEYNNSEVKYLLWEDHEEAIEQYATVATKAKTPLYKGDYAPTKPIKNEWLTNIPNGKLVVSLPYQKNDTFGNILTPGDYLKVQINYMKTTSTDGYGSTTEPEDETLFKKIQVIDLLNANGNSIYDYYMDLLAMPVAERETQMRDDNFLQNVSPTRVLVQVEEEQEFRHYAKVQGYSSLKYTFGLYPRVEEDTVLEQFRDLTRQITAAQTSSATSEEGGR